jgi:protein ImuA
MRRSAETLAALRKAIASHELHDTTGTTALGHACADELLKGGLRHGALHEVYAGDVSQGAAATGFAGGFASRLGAGKTLFWVTTDYAILEYGALSARGLNELGIDPNRFVILRLARGEDSLKAASDILSTDAVGALVLEFPRAFKALDFTASRRLSLASAQRNIPTVVLRLGIKPQASAAETRWSVFGESSDPPDPESDWGAPHFRVQLLRNRRGELRDWKMGWDINNALFGDTSDRRTTANTGRLVSAPADRSADAESKIRRAL